MKRYITWLLSILLLLLSASAVSCVGPLKGWLNVTNKEQKTEQKVDKNKEETVEKAKGWVHGTSKALQLDPAPNKYSEVASDFNKRAELTLGPPQYQVSLEIDKIVNGLLSTNAQIKIDAQKSLDKKDSEIVGLQQELTGLQSKLDKIQKEKEELGLKNSTLGQKWHNLVTWVKWIFWIVIIGIVLAVVSQILSIILPPPYSSIFSIIGLVFGGIGKLIFKIVPSSQKFAGTVDIKDYQLSEKTLSQVIHAIQQIRHTEITPEIVSPQLKSIKIADIIDPVLKDHLDKSDARAKVLEIKSKLGHI